jgi:glycosyltransferase involved in cell wall biosynthesis
MSFHCSSCNRFYSGKVKLLPFYCSCGNVIENLEVSEFSPVVKETLPCIYRGEALREINCGCSGKPKIYECQKHGEAYLRKLPKMTAEMIQSCTMCLTCGDRSLYKQANIGILSAVYNHVGGTETYWKSLHKLIGVTGLATPQQPKSNRAPFPVFGGTEAVEQLADSVRILLVWGITDKDELTRGPKRVAIHHGSLQSVWAKSVFENQLKWCEDAIAINEEVADYYKVRYIPNVVDFEPIAKTNADTKEKIVSWIHRDAAEKRPELARRIARALPDGWRMVATMGAERTDRKITAIGQTAEVAKLLSHATVFLSTSDQEGFGLSMAEAMLAGVPVVASPHGLGKDSRLVEQVTTTETQDWIDAILRAGSKAEFAKSYIQENFSVESVKLKWDQAIADWLKDE